MARIPAPASSPGLPASLLRKLNTAQVFFPSTHLESLGFRICVEGSGSQSLCCLHPRGDKCPPRPMYLLPFYTGCHVGLLWRGTLGHSFLESCGHTPLGQHSAPIFQAH